MDRGLLLALGPGLLLGVPRVCQEVRLVAGNSCMQRGEEQGMRPGEAGEHLHAAGPQQLLGRLRYWRLLLLTSTTTCRRSNAYSYDFYQNSTTCDPAAFESAWPAFKPNRTVVQHTAEDEQFSKAFGTAIAVWLPITFVSGILLSVVYLLMFRWGPQILQGMKMIIMMTTRPPMPCDRADQTKSCLHKHLDVITPVSPCASSASHSTLRPWSYLHHAGTTHRRWFGFPLL